MKSSKIIRRIINIYKHKNIIIFSIIAYINIYLYNNYINFTKQIHKEYHTNYNNICINKTIKCECNVVIDYNCIWIRESCRQFSYDVDINYFNYNDFSYNDKIRFINLHHYNMFINYYNITLIENQTVEELEYVYNTYNPYYRIEYYYIPNIGLSITVLLFHLLILFITLNILYNFLKKIFKCFYYKFFYNSIYETFEPPI